MDQVIGFIVLLIILSVLEKVLKGQKGKTRRPPPGSEDWEATDEERDALEKRSISLRELLAEELGLNSERRPTATRLPGTSSAGGPGGDVEIASLSDRAVAAPPTGGRVPDASRQRERIVYYPTPRPPEETGSKGGTVPAGPGAASALRAAEARRLALSARRRGGTLRARRRGEDRLPLRRGEPVSLEQPRQPEDHRLFHERYSVPQPVSTHEEFHTRYVDSTSRPQARRAGHALPDDPGWSAVQRAIIWSEILGPPRGLD